MSIKSDLKKDGIEIVERLDTLKINSIARNISIKLCNTFPQFNLNQNELFIKLSRLDMYKANMPEGMAEANYFYKNSSIYFNSHIADEDLEEFAIHECIHYLQEIKDKKNYLVRMGLCDYINMRPYGLSINEAAVQYTASWIIGVEPDFEKYYDISFFTPSPSYYPLECALLNQIIYFTGNDVLFKSVLFSTDDFKNKIVELTSEEVYTKFITYFDKLLQSEENVIKLNSKISLLEDGNSKYAKYVKKLSKLKHKIVDTFFNIQNLIIPSFFNSEFNNINNLEELEHFRHKLYKFSDIIGNIENYNFFDCYYAETMNKLEHKCNILENGGTETALSSDSGYSFFALIRKFFNIFSKDKNNLYK